MKPILDDQEAFGALLILDYLQGLFLASGRVEFSKEQIMIAFNCIKNDPEIIGPEVALAYELATEEI